MTRFLGGSDWLSDDARWGLSSWDYYRRGPATVRDPRRWSTLWSRTRTDALSGSWAEWQINGAGKRLVYASSVSDAGKVWLVKATPYDPVGAAETTVYFSAGRPDMAAPVYDGVLWPARLTTAISTQVSVFEGEFGGGVPTFGVVQIALVAGEYDSLLDYYWDGRDIFIYRGRQDAGGVSDMALVFKGTVRSVQWDRYTLTINLADYGEVLQKPIQTTLYAGTGGAEGGSDLTGKPKPLAFGTPKNIEATLVDSAYLVYQYHSRQANGVDWVYDQAVAMSLNADYTTYADLIAALVPPGKYATCNALGLFRLGATPVGPVTADVTGDAVGGFVYRAADIIARIADDFTDLESGDRDWAAFSRLNSSNGAPCSIYVATGDNPSAADLFTQLMVSVGGFWTFTPDRLLTVRQVAMSTPVVAISYDYGPLALDSVARAETPPPYWRSKMGYSRSWRVQSSNEIAAAATIGIGIDINYVDFATPDVVNGKAIIRGFDLDNGRADVDGWYYLDGALVTLPRAQFADGSTIHSSQPVQSYILHDYDPVTASFKDLFAGAAATDLSAHTPDTGTSWSDISGITRKFKLNGSGQASVSLATSAVIVIYRANNAPSSADMFSEFQLDAWDETYPNAWGIIGRYQSATSMYALSMFKALSVGGNKLTVGLKRVTGVSTVTAVGDLVDIVYTPGMKWRLTCVGSTISGWYKNPGSMTWVLAVTGTDSGIVAAGNGGLWTGALFNAGFQTAPAAKLSNYRDGNMRSLFTFGGPEYPAVVLVRYSSGSWEYDDTTGWVAFTPTDSMTIIGSLTRNGTNITSAAITQPQRVPSTDVQTVIVRAAFVGEAQRFVTTSDTAVQTRHKLAREREVSSLLDNASDATTENARQFALLDAKWDIYRVPVQRIAVDDYRLRLGDTVTLKLNRFGLTTGKDMIIGGMATGADADETILTLWG